MADDAVKFSATQPISLTGKPTQTTPPDKKVFGVGSATVMNNIDCTGEGRVMLLIPWLPGYTPWARVSTPMAGLARGTYFIPQVGDEVLVAFNHGDVREPYVLGTLWNTIDRPPSLAPTDPVTKRKIRTPLGHELSFDEATQSVTLASNTLSTVTLDPTQATISTPTASVTVGKDGSVTITAAQKITLQATDIEITATGSLSLLGLDKASLTALGECEIAGATVLINS